MRGVMEKCTYCLQRISNAKITAKNNRDEKEIETLQTACQQACPTNAIVFGDISNKDSLVSKKRKSKRRYDLLQTELNTKPRTIYLAKVKKHVWNASKKEKRHGHH
jgi:molybdopterin-containing oxidoreductase family iron-sulfur binding subunit